MKALIKFLYGFLIPLAVIGIWSCEDRNDDFAAKGKAEFSLGMPEEGAKSSSGSSDDGIMSYHIMVSIEDSDGNEVISDSLIPVYSFGPAFTSENIELRTGDYNLTKFLVINSSGEVIYATPIEGSELAYLVNDPLPIGFSIKADQITRVAPEVLLVAGQTPGQFGYASFGMQIVRPLDFWTACIIDCPQCLMPSHYTTARLTIYAANGWHYAFKLEASLNHLIIRGGSEVYYFLLEKEGYQSLKMRFSAEQLKAATKENPLILKIPMENSWEKLVLQPGPDEGKDAMISNLEPDKNFGDYKYFEATYLSEPVLTVMRSNRSMIWFNLNALPKSAVIKKVLLVLHYDLPVPFDPGYITDKDPVTGLCRYGGVLQQIVEPWEEYKVTWNTQPKTITSNQVFISPFNLNVNMITVDVTRLFVQSATTDQVSYPNYGMLFRLWPIEHFPGFRFASSDYPLTSSNIKMWPQLTVYYTIN